MKLYEGKSECEREREGETGPVLCRPAETRADYQEAFRLAYRQYVAAGLIPPNPTGFRIAPHQLQPACTVILAEIEQRVVGTVSLVEDGPAKLPMDRLFPQAVDELRSHGLRLAEVGCLASHDDSQQFPLAVYVELTRATIHYSRLAGCDRMIAAVHPRHSRFYRRAMGFARLSGEASYDLVNNNAAICVCGNPNDADGYREPWREHFFSGPWTGQARRRQLLPEADLRYFQNLRELIDRRSTIHVRRAG